MTNQVRGSIELRMRLAQRDLVCRTDPVERAWLEGAIALAQDLLAQIKFLESGKLAHDPIAAAVDAQLDPLKDELTAIGRKLAKETK